MNEIPAPGTHTMTYVSNAGVLIQLRNRKILIDGLCHSHQPFYKDPPVEIKEKIIKGFSPFDHLDLMLITHPHSDHFDPGSILEFHKQNPQTIILSTHEVMAQMKAVASDPKHGFLAFKTELHQEETIQVQGITIRILSTLHFGKGGADVRHFSYLIDYGLKLLHVGDASPIPENFAGLDLQQTNINWLIAPFPYLALPSARNVVKELINPQKMAVVHLPYPGKDRFGWIRGTQKSFERVKSDFIETTFCEVLGSTVNLSRCSS